MELTEDRASVAAGAALAVDRSFHRRQGARDILLYGLEVHRLLPLLALLPALLRRRSSSGTAPGAAEATGRGGGGTTAPGVALATGRGRTGVGMNGRGGAPATGVAASGAVAADASSEAGSA